MKRKNRKTLMKLESHIRKMVLAFVAAALILTMGSGAAFAAKNDKVKEPDVLDFVTTETVITAGDFDFDLVFEKMSDSFVFHEAEHKGTNMILDYTTDVYEDGVTYNKWCRVYLPYGYNPEDTEKKYNVIYFQHGNNGSPNEFFDKVDKKTFGYGVINIFDNLMDPVYGVMEPCIIVCPTYYLYASKETPNLRPDADQSAGDGNYPGIPANYYREVVEDLIPAVEGQLNTWLEDPSEEGIIATREHRLWSGYSRGSVCTWNLFCKDFSFFKYWMPMSAQCVPYSMGDERNTDEAAYEAIKTAIEQNPEYDFFLFTTCGGEADAGMVGQIQYFLKQENGVFSYGLDPEINNFYFTRSAFTHRDEWMPYTLFNARGILFDGTVIRDNSNTAN